MSEAITNAKKHAYPLDEEYKTRWWMFSQVKDKELTVVICDLGIGIPASLMKKPEMEDYLRKIVNLGSARKQDRALVQVAINSYKTSSKMSYRGKGLPQMKELVVNAKRGQFRVQSRYGYYYLGNTQNFYSGSYTKPIIGTTVQWTLSLVR
jgi:hypothetical protein